MGFAVLVATIGWFAFASIDPNYKWIFIDDNVMRVRNAVFIAVAAYWLVVLVRWARLARGKSPLAVISCSGDRVYVVKHSLMPFIKPQTTVLSAPVVASYTSDRSVTVLPGMHLRSLILEAPGGRLRVNAAWPWD